MLNLVHKLLKKFDYARSLELTETFFWNFTDNYIELVKTRAYGDEKLEGTESAKATLQICLTTLLKLFAPFLPFVTEEIWSNFNEGSIHKSTWPKASEIQETISLNTSSKTMPVF